MKAYKISSFAKTAQGGNLAGIVLDADRLSDNEMLRIASFLGFSETAFVMKSEPADFKLRFFTPSDEVDLCGHATIGTFCAMASLGRIKPGNYLQETKAGILSIEIRKDLSVMMQQPLPGFYEMIDKNEIADSLNIGLTEIEEALPVQIISTGLRDILIPVKSLAILNTIQPDMEKIIAISKKYNAVGYHVFTMESNNHSTACCRNFAPLYDIPEESATGTSNGALGCYLHHYGLIPAVQASDIVIEQGYSMNKPSEILVSLALNGREITDVKVGGKALNLTSVEIFNL